jgi:hypothetical protein
VSYVSEKVDNSLSIGQKIPIVKSISLALLRNKGEDVKIL